MRVKDIERSLFTAKNIMGLREVVREGDSVLLTNGRLHHTVEYIASDENAVDHIGLVAANSAALAEVRRRVVAAGFTVISNEPLDPGIEEGFAFIGPEGFVYEIYRGMGSDNPLYIPTGVQPTRFGHVNIYSSDAVATTNFLVDVMDFRLSDKMEDDGGFFLRCNVDHHGIAVMSGRGVLHHHAWEVQSIADLSRLGDCLDANGEYLIWGPVRHGIGRNIAAYFVEPSGTVVEFYTDMERIYDEDTFEPGVWTRDNQRFYSFWTPMRNPSFGSHGTPPASKR